MLILANIMLDLTLNLEAYQNSITMLCFQGLPPLGNNITDRPADTELLKYASDFTLFYFNWHQANKIEQQVLHMVAELQRRGPSFRAVLTVKEWNEGGVLATEGDQLDLGLNSYMVI